jgi:hypothetical protein
MNRVFASAWYVEANKQRASSGNVVAFPSWRTQAVHDSLAVAGPAGSYVVPFQRRASMDLMGMVRGLSIEE